ncbi:response regulator [Ruegeria lacuscaerulensis]|uniref:response regulator n=1 Tax=Ruegeria lacuscaerulensis TaxID=55218 RepID=UPI00147D6BBB|nr:response regulator [Ruegeria lacuscaerulensis]
MTKILYVEDNDDNIFMLTRRLRRKGYEVLVATDGAAGIEMARVETPALVLMDLNLPVLDGWEATRRLKAAPETGNIPVIALSAFAMAGDRDRALDAGCDDYVSKPIDFDLLHQKINSILTNGSAA